MLSALRWYQDTGQTSALYAQAVAIAICHARAGLLAQGCRLCRGRVVTAVSARPPYNQTVTGEPSFAAIGYLSPGGLQHSKPDKAVAEKSWN